MRPFFYRSSMKIFLFLIFLFPHLHAATTEEIASSASASREWHTLLHYKRNIYFQIESQADGAGFFYDENGKYDPKAEMIASVKAFQDESRLKDARHPQCAFPARFNYLKKIFNLNPTIVECKDYKWWRDNLPFHSVTIIFASYYANNPASVFGHSFMRINSSDKKSISDYGVDFSALTDTDSGVIFAVKGILGGYIGQYNLKPYYIKMNEYIENENRDLWEYDLNLSSEQIDRLLGHLWELQKNTYFDYYFFRENCSYQLLTLLEVASPEWHLSDEFDLETIPVDSVKAITRTKGAIKEVNYRPAFKKTVTQRLENLSRLERTQMKSLVNSEVGPGEVTSPRVLEAAIAQLRYERFEEKKFTAQQEALLKTILIQRAKVGGKVEYSDIKETLPLRKLRPDLSHDSQKYSFAFGNNSSFGQYGELTLRASLHDLLDPDEGFPQNSQIEMSRWKFRSQGSDKLYLEELKYAEAFSLFPLTRDEFKWSWRVLGRTYRVNDGSCDRCLSHNIKSSFGLTLGLPTSDLNIYSLINFTAEAGRRLYRGYRIAPGVSVGTIWKMADNLKFQYEFEVNRDLNRAEFMRQNRLIHEASLSFSHALVHELRFTGRSWFAIKDHDPVEEAQLSYSFYY